MAETNQILGCTTTLTRCRLDAGRALLRFILEKQKQRKSDLVLSFVSSPASFSGRIISPARCLDGNVYWRSWAEKVRLIQRKVKLVRVCRMPGSLYSFPRRNSS